MWIAVFNNLPEMILGAAWSGVVLTAGIKLGRWLERRKRA